MDNDINNYVYNEENATKYCKLFHPSSVIKKDKIVSESSTSPLYYRNGKIETWDFIIAKNFNFLEGNIIKYVVRWRHKNGIEDLKKALVYLDKLIMTAKKLNVTLPYCYSNDNIDTWDFILDKNLNFLEGKAVEYIVMWRQMNDVECLRGAQACLDKLIEEEESK